MRCFRIVSALFLTVCARPKLLHGSNDLQVPVDQTQSIAKVIKENGNKVELEIYEGEGHGFRMAKNIKASLEKELKFYQENLFLKATIGV